MFADDYLEDEYREPYGTWKADPTPEANTSILKTLDPVIQKGLKTYGSDQRSPLLVSKARMLTLQGLRNYDSKRSRLQTHLMNQYRGLQRASRQQNEVLRAPERIIYDAAKLRKYEDELTHELGREPTDQELLDRTGFSGDRLAKVRGYRPGYSEGQMEQVDSNLLSAAAMIDPQAQQAWIRLVYEDMPPLDQKIMEYSLGMNGRKPLSNLEIAKKLGRSPGAISQRKAKIQQVLDQEQELSPFLGD